MLAWQIAHYSGGIELRMTKLQRTLMINKLQKSWQPAQSSWIPRRLEVKVTTTGKKERFAQWWLQWFTTYLKSVVDYLLIVMLLYGKNTTFKSSARGGLSCPFCYFCLFSVLQIISHCISLKIFWLVFASHSYQNKTVQLSQWNDFSSCW